MITYVYKYKLGRPPASLGQRDIYAAALPRGDLARGSARLALEVRRRPAANAAGPFAAAFFEAMP